MMKGLLDFLTGRSPDAKVCVCGGQWSIIIIVCKCVENMHIYDVTVHEITAKLF